jgi:hypothetical protein
LTPFASYIKILPNVSFRQEDKQYAQTKRIHQTHQERHKAGGLRHRQGTGDRTPASPTLSGFARVGKRADQRTRAKTVGNGRFVVKSSQNQTLIKFTKSLYNFAGDNTSKAHQQMSENRYGLSSFILHNS